MDILATIRTIGETVSKVGTAVTAASDSIGARNPATVPFVLPPAPVYSTPAPTPAVTAASSLPSWLPFAALAVLGVLVLSSGRGRRS